MFRLEIADNEKARFVVGLIRDGHERWELRLQTLIKQGQEDSNMAAVAHTTMQRAAEIYQEIHQEFEAQMEAEVLNAGQAA